MITLENFVKAINYKITGGSEFCWKCFGPNARYLDSDDNYTYSVNAIFDSVEQTVYLVEAWDYLRDREYRWINPEYQTKHELEAKSNNLDPNESLDGKTYIQLDVAEDMLEKIQAIVEGKDYDDRVKVPVDFTDEELLKYMKLAHDRDITFNQLVEEALRHAIEEHRAGRLTKVDTQSFIREQDENHPSI